MYLRNIVTCWRCFKTRWIPFYIFALMWFFALFADAVVVGKDLMLSEFVSYYEPLGYSKSMVSLSHRRVRRSFSHYSNNSDKKLNLNFTAHGRLFNLILKRETSLFSNTYAYDLLMKNNFEGISSRTFHPSNIYEGAVLNEPLSYVQGFIHNNIFEGRILYSDGDEFIIESSRQYDDLNHEKIHSVIYRVKDIIHRHPYHCGVIRPRSDMTSVKREPIYKSHVNPFSKIDNTRIKFKSIHRERRAVKATGRKRICEIYARADPTYIASVNHDEGRAMYLISQHIKTVANMFQKIDFDEDGNPDGYSLVIKNLDTIDISNCKRNYTNGNCKFAQTHIGAAKFLDLASTDDSSAYCLSYVFTTRDFDDGILGLAFMSSTEKEKRGGICDQYEPVEGVMKTLNTGIISNSVYGRRVAPKITDLILAHEIAHSFGSAHDSKNDRTCSPGKGSGNYLMYSQAQYGTAENNFLLSPCSKSSILENLKSKASKCFTEPGKSICGNKIVEPGEECDCGYRDEASCSRDPCCQGANRDGFFGCTFAVKAKKVSNRCSPSQGLCCNPTTCQPYQNNTRTCSLTYEECTKTSKCIDTSYKCQKPELVPERSFCNDGNNICIKGKCLGSLCLLNNKIDCQCSDEKTSCKLCCQDVGNTSSCRVFKWTSHSVDRPVGSPCDQFQGRCNRLHECQRVNENGILSRLKKFLFPNNSLVNIYIWAKDNWWACILIGLALILFIIAFVCSCKRLVPSDGKRKRDSSRPFLCISSSPEPSDERSPVSLSNSSPRNYLRTPTEDPPSYDDSPPGYNTALRENLRYPPSYELEIRR